MNQPALNVRTTADVLERVDELAAGRERSRSNTVRVLISEALKHRRDNSQPEGHTSD